MLTLRQRIGIGGGVIGLVLLALLGWWLYSTYFKKTPVPSPVVETDTEIIPPIGEVPFRQPDTLPPTGTSETSLSPEEIYAKQIAKIFVERLWSYSNQNDNQHIDDVLGLATEEMQGWIRTQRTEQSQVYEGVTTEVLSSRVTAYTAGTSAALEVGARQTIRKAGEGTVAESTKNIIARVELIKNGDQWLVSGLFID